MITTHSTFYLSVLLILALTKSSQAGFYRWIDEKGIVHYTDAIPPENAQSGHLELSASGMHIKQVSAALSKEQIAAKNAKSLTTYDEHLVANYLSVTELEAVYQGKIVLLEKNKQFMQTRRDALRIRMEQVKTQIAEHKAADNQKQLQDFVGEAAQTLQSYDNNLVEMDQEKAQLQQNFERDKQRLNELLANKN